MRFEDVGRVAILVGGRLQMGGSAIANRTAARKCEAVGAGAPGETGSNGDDAQWRAGG